MSHFYFNVKDSFTSVEDGNVIDVGEHLSDVNCVMVQNLGPGDMNIKLSNEDSPDFAEADDIFILAGTAIEFTHGEPRAVKLGYIADTEYQIFAT